ncbi:NADH dehydrogenase [Verrucomicrobia bacterium IMCC26134]|jgi:NADH-quinone oxidoreductase subunit H|nr:NADH dehydrogenase [Verrucomicrobia bacterium IMCC26134]
MSAAADSFLERAPLELRDWAVQLLPAPLQWISHHLITIVAVLAVFGLFFAFTTVAERKLLGRLQNRLGPNRAGLPKFSILPWHIRHKLFGLSQPFADAVKALTKEDIVPAAADKVLHFLAPVVVVGFSLMTFAVLPFGRNLIPVELDAALLYFFAAGSASELAIFMAGWSSRNKYSLLAAMRALAQLISYELPLILSVVPVVLVASTLSTSAIVQAQGAWTFGVLPHWFVFTPWGFAGFIIFLISALAESNRSPFDLPEAESELVAGHLTEYSGFKYALFFMAEYFGLTALSGLGVTVFLGGWQAPCELLYWVPSYLWFMGKLILMIMLFIWVRGTLLRLRIDQLTRLSWQFLVPLALLNVGNAAFWALTAQWSGPLQLVRWAVSAAIVIVPFLVIGRSLSAGYAPRTYRYAP